MVEIGGLGFCCIVLEWLKETLLGFSCRLEIGPSFGHLDWLKRYRMVMKKWANGNWEKGVRLKMGWIFEFKK